MVVPPAPDQRAGLTNDAASTHPRALNFRVVLLGVLVLAVLASAGTLVWLLADRRGEAVEEQAQREQVMSQARQFVLRVNTYGPDLLEGEEMPEYREQVTEVITPKFSESFSQGVTAAEQTVAQAGLGRTAEVFGAGVASLDADSATALVAGSFVNSYPRTNAQGKVTDQRIDDEPVPLRLSLSLRKIDGEWLVDDFEPVTGEGG